VKLLFCFFNLAVSFLAVCVEGVSRLCLILSKATGWTAEKLWFYSGKTKKIYPYLSVQTDRRAHSDACSMNTQISFHADQATNVCT
jgi:hypothetical protein